MIFATGYNSSIVVKGNVELTDNAHLFTESYSNPVSSSTHDNFVNIAESLRSSSVFNNNVTVSENAKFGSYGAGIVTVHGDVSAESGGHIDASVSDSRITIKGNASVDGLNSQVSASFDSTVTIEKDLNLTDNGKADSWGGSTLDVKGSLISDKGIIFAGNNSDIFCRKQF